MTDDRDEITTTISTNEMIIKQRLQIFMLVFFKCVFFFKDTGATLCDVLGFI